MGIITKFPDFENFQIYLLEERDIKISSIIKSCFFFVINYFKNRSFTKKNVRLLLHKLRTTTEFKNKPLKKATLNKYLIVVKYLARYLNIKEFDDFKGYQVREDEVKPLGDLISDREMRLISEVNPKRNDFQMVNLRYRAALTLMRFTGMPPIDLCNLTWSMDKQTHLEYYRAKTGKHMLIPLVPEVRKLLDKLPRYTHNYIFGSRQGRMKEQTLRGEIRLRCVKLGIKKHVTPYSFRYSMITWCYINAGEGMIPKIATISGHSVTTAMKHYAKFDIQVLMDALYATHPGLIHKASIDNIKRTIVRLITNLIDINKYQVDLTITPKTNNIRRLHFS